MINENFGLKNLGYSNFESTHILPRQRWYYYKEGFSSDLVELAAKAAKVEKSDWIIDPFNGSGTTTLTASLLGYNSLGIEVNPFTSFLSKAKIIDTKSVIIDSSLDIVLEGMENGFKSNLTDFSTFTKSKGSEKWLFNKSVLTTFEGGWEATSLIKKSEVSKLMKLALITSAMDNCNAKKDGKGLKYKYKWDELNFNKRSLINRFKEKVEIINEDLAGSIIQKRARILNKDSRSFFQNSKNLNKFRLCITSPPYLNTFDYTDIYRPELFLGKFIKSQPDLYKLRLKTVRSHVQAKWPKPVNDNFGSIYRDCIDHLQKNGDSLMHRDIPLMVQAYFEDMELLLKQLKQNAVSGAQIWLIVANSAYANKEIPVDLIIGNIGTNIGLFLNEIGVLRHIQKRKTRYSPDVTHLRESVIIFDTDRRK